MIQISKKNKYLHPHLGVSLIFAFLLVGSGLTGLFMIFHSGSLSPYSIPKKAPVLIGNCKPLKDSVHYHSAQEMSSIESFKEFPVFSGDQINTKENSTALLTLQTLDEIQLHEGSSIEIKPIPGLNDGFFEIKLSHQHKAMQINILNRLYIIQVPHTSSNLNIKVNSKSDTAPVTLLINGDEPINITLEGRGKPSILAPHKKWTVNFEQDQAHLIVQELDKKDLKNTLSNETQKKVGPPPVPALISPLDKAQFISSTSDHIEVILRWEVPKTDMVLEPELEIHRLEQIDFTTTAESLISAFALSLQDGTYRWRIRFKTPDGKHSEWTKSRDFSVEERAHELHRTEEHLSNLETDSEKHVKKEKNQEGDEDETPTIEEANLETKRESKHLRQNRPLLRHPAIKMKSTAESRVIPFKYIPIQKRSEQYVRLLATDQQELKIDPIANFTHKSSSALVIWSRLKNADHYKLLIYKDGLEIKSISSQENSHLLHLNDLDQASHHSYQVTAFFKNGRQILSPLTWVQIRILPPESNKPIENGEFRASWPIEFAWKAEEQTDSFELQIAKDSEFKRIISQEKTRKSFLSVSIEKPGVYYWRMKQSYKRIEGSWSAPKKIYVR